MMPQTRTGVPSDGRLVRDAAPIILEITRISGPLASISTSRVASAVFVTPFGPRAPNVTPFGITRM